MAIAVRSIDSFSLTRDSFARCFLRSYASAEFAADGGGGFNSASGLVFDG
jgi:hypothetical protein